MSFLPKAQATTSLRRTAVYMGLSAAGLMTLYIHLALDWTPLLPLSIALNAGGALSLYLLEFDWRSSPKQTKHFGLLFGVVIVSFILYCLWLFLDGIYQDCIREGIRQATGSSF